tara:strand:+ start:68192 stop:68437 length:246 start_codon:yes stop_codon:yes gene_type:complete
MESFFGFLKDTGKAFYEFVLFIVTLFTVLSLLVFAPADIKPLILAGILCMGVMFVATGRLLTFVAILLITVGLANGGHFNW